MRSTPIPLVRLWTVLAAYTLSICFCLLLTASFTGADAFATDVVGDGKADAGVTRDMLDAKIKELESDQELDEASRLLLMELYRKSISNLENIKLNTAAAEEYHRSIETAPVETRKLEQEVADFQEQDYDPDPGFDEHTTTADIAQALLTKRAALAAASADYHRLKLTLEGERDRLTIARQELADATSRQSQVASDSDTSAQPEESGEVKKAREWYRSTSLSALDSEIKKLDQELLSHGPRVNLLTIRLRRRQLSVQHLQAKVAAIEAALGDRRQADAIKALATAQAAQLAAEGKHPLLLQVAEKNAAISEELLRLSKKIDGASQAAIETEAQAKELEDSYRIVRQKLDVAGMNKALGRILQEQRTALPNRHTIQSQLEQKEQLIADITLQQLIVDEKKKELSDLDAFVENKMTEFESEPGDEFIDREAVAAQLKTMLQQRQSLYSKISTISAAYLQSLSDLEYAKQRLLEVVEQYDTFLGERLLWVRSAPNPSFESLLSFSGDAASYFSLASWSKVFELLFTLDFFSVLLLVVLLAAMVLRWSRAELLQRLREVNKPVGNPVIDRFSYSLWALVITLLISAPGPLVLFALGIKLKFAVDHNALSQALAQALLWVSRNWFFIAVLRQVCRRDGLAQRHFRWYQQALEPLRRELALLMATFLPVSFVTVLLASLDSSSMEWGIVRLAMIISMTLYALFFIRLLRSKGSVIQIMTVLDPGVLLVRWRRFWLALSVLIPLILVGLAITGYVYTALVLMGSLVETFWVVIAVIVVHQLFVRWLRMTSIQLNYQALQEERKKQLQEIIASRQNGKERPDLVVDPVLDLEHLGRDSLKLVNIVSGLFAIVGLLLVWSNVMPALGYLDTIALWSHTDTEGGEVVVTAVSLSDFGLALLFLGLLYIVYRDLPSLLELLLRQVSAMSASDRYTAITLMRYVLLLVGVFLVAGLLGLSWSQFQWMAAALGVGIGFGLQEIVANFISGLIILFERPIRVGDQVTIGDTDGIVTRIRARATTVLTWDRQELLVPNKEFITGRLLNWTLSDQVTRLVIEVGVAYGSDVSRAMALVIEAAQCHEKVLADPAPFVTFDSFGDNTLNLKLRCFIDDISTRLTTAGALREAINTAFNEAGIVIAFPQRDIHFDADQVMNVRLRSE